ncbi:MAG: hypothetical protein M3R69_16675 [Acidobacteriota bacterium]|nr:hypothetical protein [Acidobacteriota bacterium]
MKKKRQVEKRAIAPRVQRIVEWPVIGTTQRDFLPGQEQHKPRYAERACD